MAFSIALRRLRPLKDPLSNHGKIALIRTSAVRDITNRHCPGHGAIVRYERCQMDASGQTTLGQMGLATQAKEVVLETTSNQVMDLQQSVPGFSSGIHHYGRCYYELSKTRLSMLVVATTAAGYVMGSGPLIDWSCLGWTCAGTMMAAASANTFNQVMEVTNDAKMRRTSKRPLPSGRVGAVHACSFAITAGVVGVSLLASKANDTVAALGAANILLYTLAYTPLKQIHPINTWVGALVGAIPPLMGWAAATGHLGSGGWVLATALYFWQIPHFMSLAFLCGKDYSAGGFKMLSGQKAAVVGFRNCLYLLPVGFFAQYLDLTSSFFSMEAMLLTLGMGSTAAWFYLDPTILRARRLFYASLLYLPLFMGAMLFHRVPNSKLDCEILTQEALTSGFLNEEEQAVHTTVVKKTPRPPIAFMSAAPFPFLPVPEY